MKQIVALAGLVYHRFMAMLENEPGEYAVWKEVSRLNAEASNSVAGREQWYGPSVDEL